MDRYYIQWSDELWEFSEFKNDADSIRFGRENKGIILIKNPQGEVIYIKDSYLGNIKKT